MLAQLLLLLGVAMAATDLSVNSFIGNVTAPALTVVGSPLLLGVLVAAVLAYMAWVKQVSLPAIFVGATFVMALMVQYSFIGTDWLYAALIIGGLITGVGIARWLGLLR